MSPEAWIAIGAIAITLGLAVVTGLVSFSAAVWLKLGRLETGQAVMQSMLETHLLHDTERFDHGEKRMDRHSVRLDDIEGDLADMSAVRRRRAKTDPQRTWLKPDAPGPIIVDGEESEGGA